MIEGRLIVCIASSWDYDPTSKHQIMKILARRNDILWINYHGTRRPGFCRTDLKDAYRTLRRVLCGLGRASPSIVQLTPLVIPGAARGPVQRWHRRMLTAQIGRAIRTVIGGRERPIQVWTFAPDVPYLVGAFDEECFVYYCVDEYTQFDGFDKERLMVVEGELIDRADVVVTTSEPLLITKRARRPDAILIRHGVDYDHFATAWRVRPERPTDLAAVRNPMFGFFGVIHHWIDRSLIAEVARLRPEYSFVLIGECKADVTELQQLDNVFLLGRRRYEDLPGYCAAFDAALLPFVMNGMTRSVNPVKLYEYLAAGLPVVSTPLPEARRYDGPVTVVNTAEGFAAACDRILSSDHPGRREAISRIVEDESWLSKTETLSNLIMHGRTPHESTGPIGQPTGRTCAGVL